MLARVSIDIMAGAHVVLTDPLDADANAHCQVDCSQWVYV